MTPHTRLRVIAFSFVIASAFTVGVYFLISFRKNESMEQAQFAREYVFTPLGNPYPFDLKFVAQYRFVAQIGEFLIRRDRNQQIIPGLAKDWKISEDRKSVLFDIREEIYTAEEVAQSLRRIVNFGQTSHSNFASQVESIDVLGPSKLRLRSKGDAAALLSPLVMADAVILPDDHWQKDASGKNIVDWRKSRGPYIWQSGNFPAEPGGVIRFVPNTNHYRYETGQVGWEIVPRKFADLQKMDTLKELISQAPSYTTLRNSQLFKFLNVTPDSPSIPKFFETKLNSVAFIQLNQNSNLFSQERYRLQLLKRVFEVDLPLRDPSRRAFQFPQPGLTGRVPDEEMTAFKAKLSQIPSEEFPREVIWSFPENPEDDTEWHTRFVDTLGLPKISGKGSLTARDPEWKDGKFDAFFRTIGMSDTDPISSASFIFSPLSGSADLPDGRILKILNSAKGTTSHQDVSLAIRKAFFTALEQATIIPLYYVSNRHYHSNCIELNISDPYAEQVDLRNIRINDQRC